MYIHATAANSTTCAVWSATDLLAACDKMRAQFEKFRADRLAMGIDFDCVVTDRATWEKMITNHDVRHAIDTFGGVPLCRLFGLDVHVEPTPAEAILKCARLLLDGCKPMLVPPAALTPE